MDPRRLLIASTAALALGGCAMISGLSPSRPADLTAPDTPAVAGGDGLTQVDAPVAERRDFTAMAPIPNPDPSAAASPPPPLQISTVKAFQLNRYITAWLSAEESYTLRVGQPKLGAPVYDIAYFKDSIPNQPAILQVQNFEVLPEKQAAGSDATFFTSKTIIWIAIVGIAAVLGIMSVRLIKEQSGK